MITLDAKEREGVGGRGGNRMLAIKGRKVEERRGTVHRDSLGGGGTPCPRDTFILSQKTRLWVTPEQGTSLGRGQEHQEPLTQKRSGNRTLS